MMNKKGFSLLELIIVLALMAILITYAIIKLGNTEDRANGIAEQAIISAFHGALNLYYARHLSWPDWPDSGDPFSILKYAPNNWSFTRHEDAGNKYWWIRCPHNKIWWIYVLAPCQIHKDCSEVRDKIYQPGKIVRCWKTPITHDYIDQ